MTKDLPILNVGSMVMIVTCCAFVQNRAMSFTCCSNATITSGVLVKVTSWMKPPSEQ